MRGTLLGRTGLEISELAFGAGVTGGILIDADEAIRDAVLRRAVAAGINWIDTAPVYGDGASEQTIGRHLHGLSPRPHVSTKVRLEAEDLRDIAGAIERSLEQSLRRLQSDRVALLQLHNHLGGGVGGRIALSPEQVLARGGVADTLDRLKQQGLVGAIGLTVAGDTRACLEVIDSGRFDTAQVYYDAINPSAAWRELPRRWRGGQDFCGILAACTRHGMGVLNIRTWAGGGAGERHPARTAVRDDRAYRCRQRGALRGGSARSAGRCVRHTSRGCAALRAGRAGLRNPRGTAVSAPIDLDGSMHYSA
jgi:D-threo-aldose 1-dehydrogenase